MSTSHPGQQAEQRRASGRGGRVVAGHAASVGTRSRAPTTDQRRGRAAPPADDAAGTGRDEGRAVHLDVRRSSCPVPIPVWLVAVTATVLALASGCSPSPSAGVDLAAGTPPQTVGAVAVVVTTLVVTLGAWGVRTLLRRRTPGRVVADLRDRAAGLAARSARRHVGGGRGHARRPAPGRRHGPRGRPGPAARPRPGRPHPSAERRGRSGLCRIDLARSAIRRGRLCSRPRVAWERSRTPISAPATTRPALQRGPTSRRRHCRALEGQVHAVRPL